jgi:hypothetical protein
VDAQTPNTLRSRINEAAFFFTRQLVAGKIAGLENFKVDRQNFKQTLQSGEFNVNDRVYEAFRTFAASDKDSGLTAENIATSADYARRRLREELATANYSTEAGIQVLLESDPQVLKAIDSIPRAGELVATFAQNHGFN